MVFSQLASAIKEQLSSTASRSDVLKPLAWIIGIFLAATLLLTMAKAPNFTIYVCLGLIILASILYGFAYTYCLLVDRDALRSETYSIHKMALEHGFFGDSLSGVMDGSAKKIHDKKDPESMQVIEQKHDA